MLHFKGVHRLGGEETKPSKGNEGKSPWLGGGVLQRPSVSVQSEGKISGRRRGFSDTRKGPAVIGSAAEASSRTRKSRGKNGIMFLQHLLMVGNAANKKIGQEKNIINLVSTLVKLSWLLSVFLCQNGGKK